MSGRSGFRKGHHPELGRFGVRRAPRTPAHLLPDWRLTFDLPRGCLVSPGPVHGFGGVTVLDNNRVQVIGKIKDHVVAQAGAFVNVVVPGIQRWAGRLTRAQEPGPTLSGPMRRGEEDVVEFLVGKRVVLIAGTAVRTVVFAT